MNQFHAVLLVITAIALSGCGTAHHHAETVIHPDGSITRSILQPKRHTPESAQAINVWDQVTSAARVSFDELDRPINTLPVRGENDDQPFFAAWKTCKPNEPLPHHYVKKASDPEVTSTLTQDFSRRDLGFVVEYLWEETLTDIVRLEDMRTARQELIVILLNLAEYTLTEGLGADYATSRLVAWLRTDGTRWFIELSDAFHDTALQSRGRELQTLLGPRMAEICERYGLCGVFRSDAKTFDLQGERVAEFVRLLLQRTVTTRDGDPISPAVATEILAAFQSNGDDGPPGSIMFRIHAAHQQGVENYPGGREAFELKLAQLVTRIWGVNCFFLGSALDQFRFTLDVPGLIVETDGLLLGDSRVRWQFSASEAYPAGYRMRVRSLDDRTVELRSREVDLNPPLELGREELLEVVMCLDADEKLLAVARACQAAGSLAPLEAHCERLSSDPAAVDRASIAGKLLRIASRK